MGTIDGASGQVPYHLLAKSGLKDAMPTHAPAIHPMGAPEEIPIDDEVDAAGVEGDGDTADDGDDTPPATAQPTPAPAPRTLQPRPATVSKSNKPFEETGRIWASAPTTKVIIAIPLPPMSKDEEGTVLEVAYTTPFHIRTPESFVFAFRHTEAHAKIPLGRPMTAQVADGAPFNVVSMGASLELPDSGYSLLYLVPIKEQRD